LPLELHRNNTESRTLSATSYVTSCASHLLSYTSVKEWIQSHKRFFTTFKPQQSACLQLCHNFYTYSLL